MSGKASSSTPALSFISDTAAADNTVSATTALPQRQTFSHLPAEESEKSNFDPEKGQNRAIADLVESASDSDIAANKMGAKPSKPPTTSIVGGQWAYMLVMNGVGAMFLNASINAALAYLLNMQYESVTIWTFDPTPLAADIGVTILIQQVCVFSSLCVCVCVCVCKRQAHVCAGGCMHVCVSLSVRADMQ